MKSWKLVGKIKDAQGLKGEVYALIFSGERGWQSNLQTVFLGGDESSGREFEVSKVQSHKDGLILKLKGIENRNQSEALKGQLLFIPSELLISKKGERIYLNEIQGFEVFDEQGIIGQIVGFSSNGPQDLLIVEKEKKKYEIPFVEAFIVDLNFDQKQLKMRLPPGLIE